MKLIQNLSINIPKLFFFVLFIYTYFVSKTKYNVFIIFLFFALILLLVYIILKGVKFTFHKFEKIGLFFMFYISVLALLRFESTIFISTGKILLVFMLYYIIRIIKEAKLENYIISRLNLIGIIYVIITAVELISRPLYFFLVKRILTYEIFSNQYSLDVYNNHIGGFAQINTINAFILGFIILFNLVSNKKGFSYIVSVIAFLGILFSGGKTAIFSFIIIINLYYFHKYFFDKKKIIMSGFVIIIILLICVLLLNKNILNSILKYPKFNRYFNYDIMSESFNSRQYLYHIAISIFKTNPIFGIGIGGFSDYSDSFNVHNLFLQLLVETGIFGTFFFLIYWFGIFFTLIKIKLKTNIIKIAILINIYFLLNSIFSNALFLPMISCIVFIINSIAVNNLVENKNRG